MVDSMVGTDQNRQLLAAKDWYYSDLHRRLMAEFFEGMGEEIPAEIRANF